jgi:hypothetical protein
MRCPSFQKTKVLVAVRTELFNPKSNPHKTTNMLGMRRSSPPAPVWSPSQVSVKNEPLPSPMARVILESWDEHDWHQSSDAMTDWLNARWRKTGFEVSYETVCFYLRSTGRIGVRGLGDHLHGAFYREV